MRHAEANARRLDWAALRTGLLLFVGLTSLLAFSYGIDWLLRAENLPVKTVRFEGPFRHVTHAELEAAVRPVARGNFFLMDLEAVKQRIESIPWVYRASVRREFPQGIDVRFSEQQVVGHWGANDWMNASGEVVRLPGVDGAMLPSFDGPEGTGPQVLAAHEQFSAPLAEAGLRVAGLALSPRRSWRIELESGDGARFALVLDHEQPQVRLERFARMYTALAAQAAEIRQVDLRYVNGFAIEWRTGRDSTRVAGGPLAPSPRNEG